MNFSEAVSILKKFGIYKQYMTDGCCPIYSVRYLTEATGSQRPNTLYLVRMPDLILADEEYAGILNLVIIGNLEMEESDLCRRRLNVVVLAGDSDSDRVYNKLCDSLEKQLRYDTAMRQLTSALFSNEGIQHLVDTAYGLLKNPVWVLDAFNEVIVKAGAMRLPGEEDLPTQARGVVLPGAVHRRHVENEVQNYDQIEYFNDDLKMDIILQAIRIRGIVSGHIVLFAQLHPFEENDAAYIRRLAALIGQELQKTVLFARNGGEMQAFFLNDLLTTQILHSETIQYRQKDVGFTPREYMYVAVITPTDGKPYDMGLVASQLRGVLPGSIFLVRGHELIILLNLDRRLVPDYDEKYNGHGVYGFDVEGVLRKQAILNNLTIGISHMFHDLTMIREHYEQAKKIISIHDRYLDWNVTYFSKAAPMEVLRIVQQNDNLLFYCDPELLDLIRIDERDNSELAKTLFCYLETFGSISSATTLLHIHKNTLHYRLEKIRQILGKDFKSGEMAFRLMMSFRILSILRIFIPPRGFIDSSLNVYYNQNKNEPV